MPLNPKDIQWDAPHPADIQWETAPEGTQSHGIVDTAVDMARAIPGGIAKGASALVGLPGDIQDMLDAGANKTLSYLTGKPTNVSTRAPIAPGYPVNQLPSPPGSKTVLDTISKPVGGMYQPKTVLGQGTETVASFFPNAIAPGSISARAARVIVPGVASETAGQATKGTKYEPFARAAGALAGGLLEGAGEGVINARANPAPTTADIAAAKTATYKAAEQHGVVIKEDAWQQFTKDLSAEMQKKPFRADLHAGATSALDAIASEKGPVTLESADAVRQVVNDAIETASKNNGGDLMRATQIKGKLDDFLDGLTPSDTLSGDPQAAVPILKEARSLAQREFKSKEIEKLIDLAENTAGPNNASGLEQSLRMQFKNLNARLIKNPNLAKTFSDAERAAITRVAQGGPVENAMRLLGKFAVRGVVSGGLSTGAGYAVGGPIGAVALPAAGEVGRRIATGMTSRNAELAAELMRRGAPLAATATGQSKTRLLADILLSQQGAHR